MVSAIVSTSTVGVRKMSNVQILRHAKRKEGATVLTTFADASRTQTVRTPPTFARCQTCAVVSMVYAGSNV